MATGYRHPVNRALFDEAPLGARIADRVTGFLGSWRFLIIQTVHRRDLDRGQRRACSASRSTRTRSSCSTWPSGPRRPTPRR